MSKSSHGGSIGLVDVVVGAILFLLFSVILQKALDVAVPGLLKPETLQQVQLSGLLFFLVWGLLGNRVFRPFLDLAIEREEKTIGYSTKAAERSRDSKALSERIERELNEARLAGLKSKDQIVDDARKKARHEFELVEQEIRESSAKAQQEITRLKERARKELEIEAAKLAEDVLRRALAPLKTQYSSNNDPIMH